jgi:hypothetical protein
MKCDHVCTKCGVHEQRHWADTIAARLVERSLCCHCDGWLYELRAEDFRKNGRPRNDEEVCAMLARFTVRFETGPWTDVRIMDMAAGLAEGGFGPAFAAATMGRDRH